MESFEVEVRPSFLPVYGARLEQVPSEVKDQLDALQLWDLPPEIERFGLDGATWILRMKKGEQALTITRWSPPPGRFQTACLLLLRHGSAESSGEPLTVEESWAAERIRALKGRAEVQAGTIAAVQAALESALEALRAILGELAAFPTERQPLLLDGRPSPADWRERLSLFERLAADERLLEPLLDVAETDPQSHYVLANYRDRATKDEGRLVSTIFQLRSDCSSLRMRAYYLEEIRRSMPGATASDVTRRVAQTILAREGDAIVLNRCPECQQLTTLPTSTQCKACGHDWAEQHPGALSIDRCPNDDDPLREWGDETRCWTCGWPRKAHREVCPKCQAELPASADLQPPCRACGWPCAS